MCCKFSRTSCTLVLKGCSTSELKLFFILLTAAVNFLLFLCSNDVVINKQDSCFYKKITEF